MRDHLLAKGVLLGVLCAACAADESEGDAAGSDSAIVGDSRADGEHPEVVMLVTNSGTCTGTLIGKRTVLTARHCIDWLTAGGSGKCDVYATIDRKGNGARGEDAETIGALRCDAATADADDVARDVATVQLARAVKGVVPASLVADGMPSGQYETYGYGKFGKATVSGGKPDCGSRDDGHKRKASYDGPLGAHFGQVTCPGDSGGPHFIRGTAIVAGITSRATRVVFATYEKSAGVLANRDWITARLEEYGDGPSNR